MKTRKFLFFVLVALVLTSSRVTGVTAAKWAGEEVHANPSTQGAVLDQPVDPPGSSPTAATKDEATLDARAYLPMVSVAASFGEMPGSNDVSVGLTGFEPNAAVVNPRQPSNVVVAKFNTSILPPISQLRISTDYGATFPTVVNAALPPGLPLGFGFGGDDVLAFDSQGRLFWAYLISGPADLSVVVQQVNPITGALVGTAVDVTPGNTGVPLCAAPCTFTDDKPWIAADSNPTSPFADNVYIVWTRFFDINNDGMIDFTRVMFSRSVNGGVGFSAPAIISHVDVNGSPVAEGFVWPSHVAIGPNGDVYLAYHTSTCQAANVGTVPLLRDGTGGANFATGTIPQKNNAFSSGQATVTCNVQGTGNEITGTDFWLQGTMQPWILPDPVRAGNVYVVASDDPNNAYASGDDADVVIARSTNFGTTFTRGRVDHGPGQSFAVMPTAHIDQDGNIAVHWYDNRSGVMNLGASGFANGSPNFLLDLYGTVSTDAGLTFANDFRINDAMFDPDVGATCRFGPPGSGCQKTRPTITMNTLRIGEYNGIWAVDGIGYAVWTGNNTPPPGATTPQTTFFDLFSILGAFPDRFEPNESIDFAVAAALGSDDTYNEPGLTIHSATDVDFFKVVALHTGKLEAEIEFNERINDLDVRVLDQFGNIVTNGIPDMTQTGSSLKRLAIPVVQGEIYFVEVCDQNSAVCNPIATNTFAPQSTYDLTIINRPAPVPFELDLRATSDTGSDDDNLTSDNTPTIQLHVDDADFLAEGIGFSPTNNANLADDSPGFKVQIYDNGNPAGFATPVTGQPGIYEFAFPTALPDGPHSITARVMIVDPSDDTATAATDHFVGQGGESGSLLVSIDTTAPACSPASPPDLLDSSDDAGINIDNITTIMAPAFRGTAEANVIVHILANGDVVGIGGAGADASDGVSGDGLGAYEVTVEPLADGVYDITAVCESDAGVVSDPTPALQVTIANKVLNLIGATANVLVDLANDPLGSPPTVTGYPGVPGGTAGISGIPVVNLDVNGQALTILGSGLSDNLTFSPNGPQGGSVIRAESPQMLNLSGIGGPFTIDPGAGFDTLTVNGTVNADAIVATVDSIATVQVNNLQEVSAPIANTERLAISSDQGADTIDVTVFDTVNAELYMDAGTPATTNPVGDVLNVTAGSASGHLQKQPGGPVTGSGSVFVTYPQTTDTTTRIDYEEVESVKLFK